MKIEFVGPKFDVVIEDRAETEVFASAVRMVGRGVHETRRARMAAGQMIDGADTVDYPVTIHNMSREFLSECVANLGSLAAQRTESEEPLPFPPGNSLAQQDYQVAHDVLALTLAEAQ